MQAQDPIQDRQVRFNKRSEGNFFTVFFFFYRDVFRKRDTDGSSKDFSLAKLTCLERNARGPTLSDAPLFRKCR